MIMTERLCIKPYCEADRARLIELLTNEIIKKTFMIPDFASPAEANAMFDRLLSYSLLPERFERGIYLKDALIGFVNDVEIDRDRGEIELGWVIDPAYHNNGYATEAVAAVIERLFAMGYSRVVAGAFCENAASRRVMAKCGMRLTDRIERIEYRGNTHKCVYYEVERPLDGRVK